MEHHPLPHYCQPTGTLAAGVFAMYCPSDWKTNPNAERGVCRVERISDTFAWIRFDCNTGTRSPERRVWIESLTPLSWRHPWSRA